MMNTVQSHQENQKPLFRFLLLVLGILIVNVSECSGSECDYLEVKQAFTDTTFSYRTPDFPEYSWATYNKEGYGSGLRCKVQFTAYYSGDGVEINFLETNLPPPNYYGDCVSDYATFYDGDSEASPVIATVCGDQTPQLTSSGSSILMVFVSDMDDKGAYKGINLQYTSLNRGGLDMTTDTDYGGSSGPVGMYAVLPAIMIIFLIICGKVYQNRKRHQSEQMARGTVYTAQTNSRPHPSPSWSRTTSPQQQQQPSWNIPQSFLQPSVADHRYDPPSYPAVASSSSHEDRNSHLSSQRDPMIYVPAASVDDGQGEVPGGDTSARREDSPRAPPPSYEEVMSGSYRPTVETLRP